MLIEKVRAALSDIGKGIHNVPNLQKPKACLAKCSNRVGSMRDQCKLKRLARANQTKKAEQKVELIPKCLKTPPKTPCKCSSEKATSRIEQKHDDVEEGNMKEDIIKKEPKSMTEERIEADLEKVNLESVDKIQAKLKTIEELTESESKSTETKNVVSVIHMERASSPIDVIASMKHPPDEKEGKPDVPKTPSVLSSGQDLTLEVDENEKISDVPTIPSFLLSSQGTTPSTPDEVVKTSSEKISRKSSEKSAKLSIQVMPSVSIQGGLVMQKTLHLCIKPTGSVTNVARGDSNVRYHEIKVTPEEESRKFEVTLNEEETLECPAVCKNLECKQRPLSRLSTDFRTDGRRKVSVPNEMDQKAMLLYQSYQILDEKCNNSRRGSLTSSQSFKWKQPFRINSRVFRNPVEMGFYRSQATQCSDTSLQEKDIPSCYQKSVESYNYHEVDQKSSERSEYTDTSSQPVEKRKDTIVDKRSRKYTIADKDEQHDTAFVDLEDVPVEYLSKEDDNTLAKSSQSSKEERETFQTFSTSEGSATKASSDDEDNSGILNQTPVLSEIISDTRSQDVPEKEIPSEVPNEKELKDLPEKMPSPTTSDSSSGSSCNVEGSYSTFVGSQAIVSIPDTANKNYTSPVGSSKRRQSSDSDFFSNIKSGDKPEAEPDEVSVSKIESPRSISKVDVNVANSKSKEIKVDENIQVFLGSSSEDEIGSNESIHLDKSTIQSFIKGLTGTSQDQMQKFRSNNSFRQVTKDVEANSSKEAQPKLRQDKVLEEQIIGSTDYGEFKSSVSTVAESKETKSKGKNPLHELQRGERKKDDQGDRKGKETTIMRCQNIRGNSGEGLRQSSKREIPFYRRMIDKIIEPSSSKRAMQKSYSASSPLDESISEGEVKFRNSYSIGEVIPHKYHDTKRKHRIGELKSRYSNEMRRKEIEEQSSRVARQRVQYNQWVNHYLQTQSRGSIFDSSSGSSSSKK